MSADRNGSRHGRRLRNRVLWTALAAGLFVFAIGSRPGVRASLAQAQQEQTPPSQATPDQPTPDQSTPAQAPQEQEPSPPSQPNPDADHRAGTGHSEPEIPVFDEPEKQAPPSQPEVKATFSDPKQQQIADDSAALLKLANSLKTEVDKTTPDTLSVAVIRHADEIEKLAHKMRTR